MSKNGEDNIAYPSELQDGTAQRFHWASMARRDLYHSKPSAQTKIDMRAEGRQEGGGHSAGIGTAHAAWVFDSAWNPSEGDEAVEGSRRAWTPGRS